MLVRDYERARNMARERSAQDLAGAIARYDRIGFRFAVLGLLSMLVLFFGGGLVRRFAPSFEAGHPGLHRLLMMLVPALGIAAFLIASDVLRKKRDVVDLATRLRAESEAKGGAECRPG